MRALYQQHYQGFTIKHFHEKLEKRHGYKLGYTTTRLYLQKTGTVRPAPRRGAHRRKRPRRPMRGMLLHQDGSKHAWLAGQPALDLIITMDDATSEIYSAFLVDEEGTMSSFRGLVEVIERHGLFMELYTDRGSHYFITPQGRRQGVQDPADPGRPGAQAARHRPHPGLLAGGQGPVRARLPHPPGPPAQGAGAGRDHHRRGRQPISCARSICPSTTPASPYPPRSRPRPSSQVPEALWRDVLCAPGGASRRQRQLRRAGAAASLQIPPTPLRPHLVRAAVPGARLSRRHASPSSRGRTRLASFPPAAPASAEDLAA